MGRSEKHYDLALRRGCVFFLVVRVYILNFVSPEVDKLVSLKELQEKSEAEKVI